MPWLKIENFFFYLKLVLPNFLTYTSLNLAYANGKEPSWAFEKSLFSLSSEYLSVKKFISKNSIDLFASTKSNRDETAKTNILNTVCKTNNLMQFIRLFQDRQYQTVLNKSLCNYVDFMLSRHLTDSSFESSGSVLWTITEDLIEILTLCPFLSLTETGTNGSISRQISDIYKFISTKLTRCEKLINENDEHACLLLSLCI